MDTSPALHLEFLKPPLSVLRVLRFVQDYSYLLDSPDESKATVLGTGALRSQQFASRIAERQGSDDFMFRALKVRHGAFAPELRDFAFWLRGIFKKGQEVPEDLVLRKEPEATELEAPVRRKLKRKVRTAPKREEPDEEEEIELWSDTSKSRPRRPRLTDPAHARERLDLPTLGTRGMFQGATGLPLLGALELGSIAVGTLMENGIFEVVRPPMPFKAAAKTSLQVSSATSVHGYPSPSVDVSAFPSPSFHTVPGRQPFVPGLLRQTSLGFGATQPRDLLAGRSLPPSVPKMGMAGPKTRGLPYDSKMGQVTLVAPPIKVASPDFAKKGGAISFDWRQMAKGATDLNPSSFEELKKILPAGSQALYPALPLGSLGPSAVNVPLAAETIAALVEQGYGKPPAGWAQSIEALSWSMPASQALTGSVIPTGSPATGDAPLSHAASGGFGYPQTYAHGDTPRRTGLLDFLGIPTRIAPSPGSPHALRDRHVASSDLRSSPTSVISPQVFSGFQRKALPHFQTISAQPSAAFSKSHTGPVQPMGASHLKIPSSSFGGSHSAPRSLSIPTHSPQTSTSFSPQVVHLPGDGAHRIDHSKVVQPHHDTKKQTPIGHTALPPVSPAPRVSMAASAPHVSIPHQAPPDIKMPQPPEHLLGKHLDSHPKNQSVGAHPGVAAEHGSIPSLPHAPMMPPIVAPHATVTVVKPPMPLAKDPKQHDDKHLAIQAAPSVGAAPAESAGTPRAGSSPGGSQGSKDAEVGLLANEVWSILKRRLEFESQRAGR